MARRWKGPLASTPCELLNDHPTKQKEVFSSKGDEAKAQVAQGGGGCPILGGIQGQAGCGSEHLMWL